MSRIAVLLTCFNRKTLTLRCLQSVFLNINKDLSNQYVVYILDDNSTDGTVEAIKSLYPTVKISVSEGNLYWSRGMHEVMQRAYIDGNELYFMINDDALFFDNAFETMLRSYKNANSNCAIVGTFLSQRDGTSTYGGFSLSYEMITPSPTLSICEWANWNCFLVPKDVIDVVGLIDRKYAHGAGDYDYCLMMKRNSLPIYVADDFVGYCERNSPKGSFRDASVPRIKRIKNYFSRKEYHFPSMVHYYAKNYGYKRVAAWLYTCCIDMIRIIRKKEF